LLIAFWLKLGSFNPLTLWPVMLSEMVLTVLLGLPIIARYGRLFTGLRRE